MQARAAEPRLAAQTWLKCASALVIGFGAIVALAAHPSAAGIASFFADLLFWPVDGQPTIAAPEARLLAAIGGGVMVGWGVLLWLLATRLYPRDADLARTMIAVSIGSWWTIDSLGSVIAGAPLNAVLNLAFVAIFLLPLWRDTRTATA